MPPLRIVVQTGASAGISRLFAVAFTYASLLAGGMLALMLWADTLPMPHKVLLPFVPIGFVVASIGFHVGVWRSRATDLLVDERGFRVLGGRGSGWTPRWDELDPDRIRVEIDPNWRMTVNGHTTLGQRLVAGRRDGGDVILGASLDPDEQLSFAALAEVLRDGARGGASADEGPPDVLACPGCGAPICPVDADEAPCWRCERRVAMPADLRSRVAAGARLEATRAETLRDLDAALRQPTARAANAWLLASLVVPYVAPVALCAYSALWVTWGALALAVLQTANLQTLRRRAYHRLSVVFAARPPSAPGAPLRCRACAGPLPAATAALVACPWCAADNLRAAPFERSAATWRDTAGDLAAFVAEHRARTRASRALLFAWLALAAGAALATGLLT